MTVLKVERVSGVLSIDGQFDRLDGVRSGGYFRIARGEYAWAELEFVDRAQGTVRFTEERDSEVARLCVGEKYVWLDDYWQAPLVEAIADETTAWRRFAFESASPGWDHEHCGLCNDRIDDENPTGYADDFPHFLCKACYAKHGETHDLSFAL